MKLSAHDVRRLAVHCHRDPRAVRNAYAGCAKALVTQHVREGAKELGLPPPSEAPASSSDGAANRSPASVPPTAA